MTKNEIIRELSKCNPCRIRSLFVVYHNNADNTEYVFAYNYMSTSLIELNRELARVVLSIYKLRRYVKAITVSYFSSSDGECIERSFDSARCVYSISDFIKSIKK